MSEVLTPGTDLKGRWNQKIQFWRLIYMTTQKLFMVGLRPENKVFEKTHACMRSGIE